MNPGPFSSRNPSRRVAAWAVTVGACLLPLGAALAQTGAPAHAAVPAASAASAHHVSPYVLAAQRHAKEAASAPLKVNPLMSHRPRTPRATGRG